MSHCSTYWLAPLLILTLTSAGFGQTRAPVEAALPAGPALLSVERKTTTSTRQGLYLRSAAGGLTQIWRGEPYDSRALPDRTTLVVERWKGQVLRLDANGKVIFKKTGLDRPVDVEQARDGTIIVVLNGPGQVIGLDPKNGSVRWRRTGFKNPFDVVPSPDGGIIVADSGAGRVVDLDPKGKVRREVSGLGFPNTVERLQNGHILVTTWSQGEVHEFDKRGKRVWRAKIAGTVYRAVRRNDGTTVIIEGEAGRIHILDKSGRILRTDRFKPGCVDWEPLGEI